MNKWLVRIAVKYPFLQRVIFWFYPEVATQIRLTQLVEQLLAERKSSTERKQKEIKVPFNREASLKKRQDNCNHLKGGKNRMPGSKDYAIANHVFIDGSRKIWCVICGKPFTVDEAREMSEQTTNRGSSSEIIGKVKDQLVVQEALTEEQWKEFLEAAAKDPNVTENFWRRVIQTRVALVEKNYDLALKAQEDAKKVLDNETKK